MIISGLVNGTPYTVRVAAVNAVGQGPYVTSGSTTPSTTPDAPAAPSVVSNGSGSVTVTWVAPADGGAAITSYLVERSAAPYLSWDTVGTLSAPTLITPAVVTNGTAYKFRVTAENLNGFGPASAWSTPFTNTVVPEAVTALSGVGGDASVDLSWTPGANGGSATTGFKVEYSVSPYSSWTTATASTASSPYTVTGLTNGATYEFRVSAINAVGTGPATVSDPVDTVHPGRALLESALLFVDAASYSGSGALLNLGVSGAELDMQMGSDAGPNSNSPTLLPYTGTVYTYLPSGSSVGCAAPLDAESYAAYPLGGGGATTGAVVGGSPFSFTDVGSWTHIDLLDGSSAVVASFAPTLGSTVNYTDAFSVVWTISRPASGRKATVVTEQLLAFGPDDWAEITDTTKLNFLSGQAFSAVAGHRYWGTPNGNVGTIIGKKNAGHDGDGWALTNGGGGSETQTIFRVAVGGVYGTSYSTARTEGDLVLSSGTYSSGRFTQSRTGVTDSVNTATGAVGDVTNSHPFRIGSAAYTPFFFTDMDLSAAAVFDFELTPTQLGHINNYIQSRGA